MIGEATEENMLLALMDSGWVLECRLGAYNIYKGSDKMWITSSAATNLIKNACVAVVSRTTREVIYKRRSATPIKTEDDKFREFFTKLGYHVSTDSRFDHWWHNIHDTQGVVAQVDMGVKLEYIVENMSAWHLGKEPIDRPDEPEWVCSGPKTPRIDLLFKRVYETTQQTECQAG